MAVNRVMATDEMKAVKTCQTCSHLIVTTRDGSKRFNYVCSLSGLIAAEERLTGHCGRLGVLWADLVPVAVADGISVIGGLPRNDELSPIAVGALGEAILVIEQAGTPVVKQGVLP